MLLFLINIWYIFIIIIFFWNDLLLQIAVPCRSVQRSYITGAAGSYKVVIPMCKGIKGIGAMDH